MSAQNSYGFVTKKGAPGMIADLAPYAIDTRFNTENNGVMKFGIGVQQGSVKGKEVKIPVSGVTAVTFEGVTVDNHSTEWNLDGTAAYIHKKAPIGVMRYGRIWARVHASDECAYGDGLYLIPSGDEAGYFTKLSQVTIASASVNCVSVNGRFLTGIDNGIAEIEIFEKDQI